MLLCTPQVINSPIWVSAHYTQFTQVGWRYLPVGQGSGVLDGGGTYVTLVSPDGSHVTTIMQTMEWGMSQCYKDTHAEFHVAPTQNVTFSLKNFNVHGVDMLQVRKTTLLPDDPIDPVYPFESNNLYFERLEDIKLTASMAYTIVLEPNTLVTVTTLQTGGKVMPNIPAAQPFSRAYSDPFLDYPVGRNPRYSMDQQGIFDANTSRDTVGTPHTTIQMTTRQEPNEWHGWGRIKTPSTFIGPAVTDANVTCMVLPPSDGVAGIGVGPQQVASAVVNLLLVNQSAPGGPIRWSVNGQSGVAGVAGAAGTNTQGAKGALQWILLGLNVTAEGRYTASINGNIVSTGNLLSTNKNGQWFPTLAASYAGDGAPAEFKSFAMQVNPTPTHRHTPPSPGPPSPSPPAPPTPAPPPGFGLALAACDVSDPRQKWVFSGEDGGEPGNMKSLSNTSNCLNAVVPKVTPVKMSPCNGDADLSWVWTSTIGQLRSVVTVGCHVAAHGKLCHQCLDVESKGDHAVDVFDCRQGDSNQVWTFDEQAGAGPIKHGGRCLSNF